MRDVQEGFFFDFCGIGLIYTKGNIETIRDSWFVFKLCKPKEGAEKCFQDVRDL